MKTRTSQSAVLLLWIACLIILPACKTTLEPGGPYTDPELYQIDQTIQDSVLALNGFIQWNETNKAYLVAKAPQVGALAAIVASKKDSWETDAIKARDAYAEAKQAYKNTLNDPAVTGSKAKLDAILAVIADATKQIANYRATVKPTS